MFCNVKHIKLIQLFNYLRHELLCARDHYLRHWLWRYHTCSINLFITIFVKLSWFADALSCSLIMLFSVLEESSFLNFSIFSWLSFTTDSASDFDSSPASSLSLEASFLAFAI